MRILGIDPGTTETGWCVYDSNTEQVLDREKEDNKLFVTRIPDIVCFHKIDVIAYEMVACYGMAVGKSVFETVLWMGRFLQSADGLGCKIERLYRKDVKINLCNSMKAKDSNVRQAILDRFPASGGGKVPQVGTKSEPGPLFGVSNDIWSALALCLTYVDTFKGEVK